MPTIFPYLPEHLSLFSRQTTVWFIDSYTGIMLLFRRLYIQYSVFCPMFLLMLYSMLLRPRHISHDGIVTKLTQSYQTADNKHVIGMPNFMFRVFFRIGSKNGILVYDCGSCSTISKWKFMYTVEWHWKIYLFFYIRRISSHAKNCYTFQDIYKKSQQWNDKTNSP